MSISKTLQVVLGFRDEASDEIKNFEGKMEELQPMFRKAAAVGTAAFTGIATGIGFAVNSAGKAENIGRNFEITFGESANALREFTSEFSDEFAFVESEVEQAAMSIGFQLNTMGDVGDEEGKKITESLLTAAGGLSDFFGSQMDVTQAADALSKGLSGNRAQLQQMGFRVYADDVKNMAESMGYNADELTRSQEAMAFTQLIMEQTEGSVEGLQSRMDTFTGQQDKFRTASIEAWQKLGEVFLPIATDLLEKLTPIIEDIGEWISENETLTKYIVIGTAALSALVAAVGALGMVLSPTFAAIRTVTTLVRGWSAANWAAEASLLAKLKAMTGINKILPILRTRLTLLQAAIPILGAIAAATVVVGKKFFSFAETVGGSGNAFNLTVMTMQRKFLLFMHNTAVSLQNWLNNLPGVNVNFGKFTDKVASKIKSVENNFDNLAVEAHENVKGMNEDMSEFDEAVKLADTSMEGFKETGLDATGAVKESVNELEEAMKRFDEKRKDEKERFYEEAEKMAADSQIKIEELEEKKKKAEKEGDRMRVYELQDAIYKEQDIVQRAKNREINVEKAVKEKKKLMRMDDMERLIHDHEKEMELITEQEVRKLTEIAKTSEASQSAARKDAEVFRETQKGNTKALEEQLGEQRSKTKKHTDQIVGEYRSMSSRIKSIMRYTTGGSAPGLNIGGIQSFATGGIATKPTLATVAEREPEAIIPLSKMSGIGNGGIHLHVNVGSKKIAEIVMDEMGKELKRRIVM